MLVKIPYIFCGIFQAKNGGKIKVIFQVKPDEVASFNRPHRIALILSILCNCSAYFSTKIIKMLM